MPEAAPEKGSFFFWVWWDKILCF